MQFEWGRGCQASRGTGCHRLCEQRAAEDGCEKQFVAELWMDR